MRPWLFATLAAVLAGWIFWLVLFLDGETFPEKVPIHWNIEMKPDGWVSGDRAAAWLAFLPATLSVLALVNLAITYFASPSTLDGRTRGRLDFVFFAVSLFLLSLNVQLLIAMRSGELPVKFFLGSLFVLFACIGAAMRGIPPNPYIGVRLPWTMHDVRLWERTHDFTSRLWVGGSILGLLAVIVGTPPVVCLVLLLIVAFVPIPASIVIARAAKA